MKQKLRMDRNSALAQRIHFIMLENYKGQTI
jgi:hypothetical protein